MSFRNGGGVNFSDPREMLRGLYAAANLAVRNAGNTQSLSTVAGFATEMALRGIADTTNWTASTYKTILSIPSGQGLVYSMGGPTGLAGTPSTLFEVTVDGVVTVVTLVATTTGQRAVLGSNAPITDWLTNTSNAERGSDAINAAKDTIGISSLIAELLPWQTIRSLGSPCLIFRSSLLIRMQSSESNSTTTNKESTSHVQYMSLS